MCKAIYAASVKIFMPSSCRFTVYWRNVVPRTPIWCTTQVNWMRSNPALQRV